MKCSPQTLLIAVTSTVLAIALSSHASAQRGRSVFDVSRVSLASLAEVQVELKLNDEQKTFANTLHQELNDDRRKLFEDGRGNWDEMRKKMTKLYSDTTAKLIEQLDKAQLNRLTEIYVQVNGSNALSDETVMERLKITEDQRKQLEDVRKENRQARSDSRQDFQGLSDEERREAFAKLRQESDDRLLQALTEKQRDQFAKLGGKELDYDLRPLRRRRG